MVHYDEFIQYIDEVIDYDKIQKEYGLSYSQIKAAIEKIEAFMGNLPLPDDYASQPAVQADAKEHSENCVCMGCNLREIIGRTA